IPIRPRSRRRPPKCDTAEEAEPRRLAANRVTPPPSRPTALSACLTPPMALRSPGDRLSRRSSSVSRRCVSAKATCVPSELHHVLFFLDKSPPCVMAHGEFGYELEPPPFDACIATMPSVGVVVIEEGFDRFGWDVGPLVSGDVDPLVGVPCEKLDAL